MRNKGLFVIVAFLCSRTLWGDVMPATYDGYTLSAKANRDIRMQSEAVDIYCGETCRVIAKFDMENEADEPIDLFVGFPVENPASAVRVNETRKPMDLFLRFLVRHPVSWHRVYDFQVTTGEKGTAQEITEIPAQERNGRLGRKWFGWNQSFSPGRTTIRVEYHIEPSSSYREPWLNVYYCLDTGAMWKGAIGQADVTVHFEEPLATEQIRGGTGPAGFQIDGNSVRWRFTNIEPRLQDNIQIEYMPFAIYHELEHLRSRIKENPQDEARAIALAQRYFALGRYKGVGGDYLPRPITGQEYESILARTTDPNDRAAFEAYWRNTEKRPVFDGKAVASRWAPWSSPLPGQYETVHVISDPRQPARRIKRIMDSAGFLPYPAEYVAKAKEMLESLLEENPTNADAWMVYIMNCYRFVYGAYELGGPWCPIPPRQKEIIERAYSQCPSHEGIKAWHDFVTHKEVDGNREPSTLVSRLRFDMMVAQPVR